MFLPVSRKWGEEGDDQRKKGSVSAGLRILIQLSEGESNNILKPTLKLCKTTFRTNQTQAISRQSGFLKSCCLCNRSLSPDKDVYMYRGDQGFCSIECRSRQIYMDEMRDIETSTEKMSASSRHCNHDASSRREIKLLLEEFRLRRNLLSCQKHQPIFS